MVHASQMSQANQTSVAPPPDEEVPPGDSPPRPKWILVLAVAAWCAWFVLLVAMMIYRMNTTTR